VVLLVATAATAAPAFAAQPECDPGPGESNNNCGASLEHRANPSGKGNFGQCHKVGAVEPNQSSEFNPSAQNTGEADCRTASGRPTSDGISGPESSAIARCEPPLEPVAETQHNYQPSLAQISRADCV
jgi:hypothetical protein